jgi:hypothetical protein
VQADTERSRFAGSSGFVCIGTAFCAAAEALNKASSASARVGVVKRILILPEVFLVDLCTIIGKYG